MKLLSQIKPNKVLVFLLILLFALNCISAYDSGLLMFKDNDVYISKITQLVTITLLLTFFFAQKSKMATVFFTTFLLLFLGDAIRVFQFGDSSPLPSIIANLLAYVLIVFVLFGQLKRVKFDGFVSVYLILVLMLNTYFLYALFIVVKDNFINNFSLLLYLIHGAILILMCFFAFAVYLSKETSQSITYLLMVFAFAFSDALGYICDLYVYFWLFDLLERMFHMAALFLLFKYIFEHYTNTIPEQKITLKEYFIPTTAALKEIRVHL